jgi:hypothetical protein
MSNSGMLQKPRMLLYFNKIKEYTLTWSQIPIMFDARNRKEVSGIWTFSALLYASHISLSVID